MAYVKLTDGTERTLTAEQGIKLWRSLKNPSGLNEAELDKLTLIKFIGLAWRNAPDDYIQENLDWIIPLVVDEWRVNRRGQPTRPQGDFGWKFARRWGLWEFGAPTGLVPGAAATQAALPGMARSRQVKDD